MLGASGRSHQRIAAILERQLYRRAIRLSRSVGGHEQFHALNRNPGVAFRRGATFDGVGDATVTELLDRVVEALR